MGNPGASRTYESRLGLVLVLNLMLVASFIVVTALIERGLSQADIGIRDWADSHRTPAISFVLKSMSVFGQGTLLLVTSVALAAWLSWRSRTVYAFVIVVVAAVLLVVIVGLLKVVFHRAAPHFVPTDVTLWGPSSGRSYPSGHMANVVVWLAVLDILLESHVPRHIRGIVRLFAAVCVLIGSTLLSYHWLTDMIAGGAIGLVIASALRALHHSHRKRRVVRAESITEQR